MGLITTVYGYIQEHPNLDKNLKKQNKLILKNLPFCKDDKWPPLSKEMFHIVDGPKPLYVSYWGRIITIGASLKGVEYEWEEWLNKFEKMLSRIYWIAANVHIETEWYGLLNYNWKNDSPSFKSNNAILNTKDKWTFSGDRRKIIDFE